MIIDPLCVAVPAPFLSSPEFDYEAAPERRNSDNVGQGVSRVVAVFVVDGRNQMISKSRDAAWSWSQDRRKESGNERNGKANEWERVAGTRGSEDQTAVIMMNYAKRCET